MKKKILSLLLIALLVCALLPASALAAAGMESETSGLAVNRSKVAFAGHEWWVIGDGESGVATAAGHLTLLAANNDFGTSAFRTGSSFSFENSTQYNNGRYFANNASGPNWLKPNEYVGSTLMEKMESIYAGITGGERDLIDGKTFTAPQSSSEQHVWALSSEERNSLPTNVSSFDVPYWLCSPYAGFAEDGDLGLVGDNNGTGEIMMSVNAEYCAVRPAMSIDASSVLFVSDQGAKSTATVGGDLVSTGATGETVKLTVKTSAQTLTVPDLQPVYGMQEGSTLTLNYSGATTGANQYVSCVLIDGSGDLKYYGRLASTASASSGTITIPFNGVKEDTYTLMIFSEQDNGDLYTDFCSEPVVATVEPHEHSWIIDHWEYDDTHHWNICRNPYCPITDNSQKYGYEEHAYDQQVVGPMYVDTLPTCTEPGTYYYSCVCGKAGTETFQDSYIPGHNWGVPVFTWEDDLSGATATFTCNRDKSHQETVEATITSTVTKQPTCIWPGVRTYTATAETPDGEWSFTDQKTEQVPALGHDWGEPVYTWSEDGQECTAVRTCQTDGIYKETAVATVTGTETKAPNCVAKGETTYTAVFQENWAETQTKTVKDIDATGHDWDAPIYAWSDDGRICVAVRTCKNDKSHQSPAIATVTVQESTAATCTEKGQGTFTAAFDVEWAKTQTKVLETPALGHDWTTSFTWEGDLSGATATFTCNRDNSHHETVNAEVKSSVTTQPTCTEPGGRTYTATAVLDGETYTDSKSEEISAAGHTAGEAVKENEVPATCTKDGSYDSVVSCTVCGEELSREAVTVPAGHTAGEAGKENEVPATCGKEGSYDLVTYCTVCKEELSRETVTVPKTEHEKGVLNGDRAATCTEEGYTGNLICPVCGEVLEKGQVIPKLAHDFKDGVCTVCGAKDPDYVPFTPEIVKGAGGTWQKTGTSGLSFTSNAAFADFLKVQVDGKDVDKANYEVKEGSTIVTLKASYLETLSVGKHTLAIVSNTGTATTTFTITAASIGGNQTGRPATGDGSAVILWAALAVLALGGTAVLTVRKKKAEQ